VSPDPLLLILIVVLAALTAGLVAVMLRIRRRRNGALRVLAAHAHETAVATGLLSAAGTTAAVRSRAVVVVASAGGLSFRDSADAEVLSVPAERILGIEFAPLNPRSAVRPARAAVIDGSVVDFFLGVPADDQAETVVALRAAVGRES
jgi:hypothetical protein